MQRHFYATASDLRPVFARVEATLDIQYIRAGLFDGPDREAFFYGADLPTLDQPLVATSACAGPSYLVTERDCPISQRIIHQDDGSVRYAIDQVDNPDSVTFLHGGFYSEEILLYGRVATVSNSPTATKLQRNFSSAVAKHFVKVRSFWVGHQAFIALNSGIRLTIGAESAREFDLALG